MTSYKPLVIPTQDDAPQSFGFAPCEGGVCAAAGMRAAGISAGFRKNPQRKDMALVLPTRPASVRQRSRRTASVPRRCR